MKRNFFVYVTLAIIVGVSIFLSSYKKSQIPPCVNADEAAFGYNAYSILRTGKDEYGSFMPLRLKSFDDFKLPMYSYLSIPFIAVLGLNDFAIRAVNIVLAAILVPLMYLVATTLFKKKSIGLIAAILTAINPGIYLLARQAHEGVACAVFLLFGLYWFLRYRSDKKIRFLFFEYVFLVLTTFSYQTGRLFLVFFAGISCIDIVKSKINHSSPFSYKKLALTLFVIVFALSIAFAPDMLYGVNRVKNLFITHNAGFKMRIVQDLAEQPNRIMHNVITEAAVEITNQYVAQLSFPFFLSQGDTNYRFGFQNIGVFTIIDVGLLFVGLYFLFQKKVKNREILALLILIAPLNSALTWADPSLIRVYFIIFPLILIVSYGWDELYHTLHPMYAKYIIIGLIGITAFFVIFSWDTYFFHYPKRAIVTGAWQCGYQDLATYIHREYTSYDHFVITQRLGQPYIFLLYYLKFPPDQYQKQARLSPPDEYGFGQVEQFDKFSFTFHYDPHAQSTVFIGFPDQFNDTGINMKKVKKIIINNTVVFWIYPQE